MVKDRVIKNEIINSNMDAVDSIRSYFTKEPFVRPAMNERLNDDDVLTQIPDDIRRNELQLGDDPSLWNTKITEKAGDVLDQVEKQHCEQYFVVDLKQYSHVLPFIEKAIFNQLVEVRERRPKHVSRWLLNLFDPKFSGKTVRAAGSLLSMQLPELRGETVIQHEFVGRHIHGESGGSQLGQYLVLKFYNDEDGKLSVEGKVYPKLDIEKLSKASDDLLVRNLVSRLSPRYPSRGDLLGAYTVVEEMAKRELISGTEQRQIENYIRQLVQLNNRLGLIFDV